LIRWKTSGPAVPEFTVVTRIRSRRRRLCEEKSPTCVQVLVCRMGMLPNGGVAVRLEAPLTSGTSHWSKTDAALAGLLDQVTRNIHSSNHAADLYPAQWSALRYFAKAAPQHRSAIALARYQGIEPGPTARTVRTLVDKGFLENGGSLGRGRIRRVDVTEKGHQLLLADPINVMVEALASLDGEQKRALAEALERILGSLQSKKLQNQDGDGRGDADMPASHPR